MCFFVSVCDRVRKMTNEDLMCVCVCVREKRRESEDERVWQGMTAANHVKQKKNVCEFFFLNVFWFFFCPTLLHQVVCSVDNSFSLRLFLPSNVVWYLQKSWVRISLLSSMITKISSKHLLSYFQYFKDITCITFQWQSIYP